MIPILTKRQIELLKLAKEKGIVTLIDVKIFYTTQPQEQINRLTELGYFEVVPFGKYKYTGKDFQ